MKAMILSAMFMVADMQYENEKKIQECIDKYWDARRFPRKKKKQMRKEANADYRFWCGLRDFHNQHFSF